MILKIVQIALTVHCIKYCTNIKFLLHKTKLPLEISYFMNWDVMKYGNNKCIPRKLGLE